MSTRLVIFELHARQGRPLTEVASIMGLSYSGVHAHWQTIQADIAAQAPTTPEQLSSMREQIDAHIQTTIEATYARAEIVDEETGKATVLEMPASPQMLAVRLKALDQRAKLYGLNLEAQAEGQKLQPYAPPLEIAGDVKAMMLERWGRKDEANAGLSHGDGSATPQAR